jgi:hypothetical protein
MNRRKFLTTSVMGLGSSALPTRVRGSSPASATRSGKLHVEYIKEACPSVKLRAPEWVESENPQLLCVVNAAPRSIHWSGRYVEVGAATPGDVISMTFPLPERTVKEQIGASTYTLALRGNTVVSIDPSGEIGPLYQGRKKYRNQDVQWVQVKRFVPEEDIRW